MGTWGVLPFDDDDANDWAYGLDEVSDPSLVDAALARVEAETEYLEAPIASEGLAACDVLARLLGRAGYKNAYTEKVDRWVTANRLVPAPEMLTRAQVVLDRILGSNSEMRELWDDSEDAANWHRAIAELRARISS